MKRFSLFSFALLLGFSVFAQKTEQTKLVVGIVVDQMRVDYIHRYWNNFGENGFRRMINEGFFAKNAHYNYIPTYTGPGHASVYTGSTPAFHGIIGNAWYDKKREKVINCVSDFKGVQTVGKKENSEGRSPDNLLAHTITDELKLSSQMKSKVYSMSIKDRGAILPGGHSPNLALWFDYSDDKFISSTYYTEELPKWLNKFNKSKQFHSYKEKVWEPLMPLNQYTASGPDNSPYERSLKEGQDPVFPYDMREICKERTTAYISSPFGNDLLTDLAKVVLEEEKLGQGEQTDFLAISYSSTDIVGHSYGPNAVEVQDMYMRLDQNIADLLNTLDQRVGKGNYTVFLTADHGVAEVPQRNIDLKLPAGYYETDVEVEVAKMITEHLGLENPEVIYYNNQVFLVDERIQDEKKPELRKLLAEQLLVFQDIQAVFTLEDFRASAYNEEGQKGMLIRGYHFSRSGDLAILYPPGYIGGSSKKGTTHGSGYNYDTHVPILLYGAGIKQGSSKNYHAITDIAPTIAHLLNLTLPNAATGQPILEAID